MIVALPAAPPALVALAACQGADPAITNVATTESSNGGLSLYTLHVTVTNVGSSGQRSNVLQSVAIWVDGEKRGEKGLPPLAAGANYTFPYDVQRAQDAATGSTRVDLHLIMHQPAGVSSQHCSVANDSRRVRV
jgi:hypothetical protein